MSNVMNKSNPLRENKGSVKGNELRKEVLKLTRASSSKQQSYTNNLLSKTKKDLVTYRLSNNFCSFPKRGINTGRRIEQSESYLSQNMGDEVPLIENYKREYYTKMISTSAQKELDSPVLLRQISVVSKAYRFNFESFR